GIDSASIVSSLCDKGLIFESGHLDAPGRPSVFSTTANFLRCFGLEKISDLPDVLDSAQFLEKSIDEESIDEKSINDESINEESSKNTPSDGDTAL
ncbi:MAG: SMC-Scp complex subunit ScpB, partial [Clostridia bacterium]